MLKGTAEICLTNVKTGEKERYVEHNIFTKALEYLHQSIGSFKGPYTCTTGAYEPAYMYLLGGIALWDKRIPENVETVVQPNGVKMVGCAAYNQVNATTSPRRGSYNATESVLTVTTSEKSMKFVYDFATNQANGEINCISLTSYGGGWNGFGGDDGAVDQMETFGFFLGGYFGPCFDTDAGMYLNRANAPESNVLPLYFVDPTEDVFYQAASVSTAAVLIEKRRANIYQRSVFVNNRISHPLVESISVSLPTTLSGVSASYMQQNFDEKSETLYICVCPSDSGVSKGNSFYVIEIDQKTFTAIVHTVKAPSVTDISFSSGYLRCYGGFLYYFSQNTQTIYRINLEDSSYTKIAMASGWYAYSMPIIMDGKLYFRARTYRSGDIYRYAMMDLSTQEIEYMGVSTISTDCRYGFATPIKGNPLIRYYAYYYSRNGSVQRSGGLWANPNYLSTINNLSLPIEKTSDKTMKITYTIQEV